MPRVKLSQAIGQISIVESNVGLLQSPITKAVKTKYLFLAEVRGLQKKSSKK